MCGINGIYHRDGDQRVDESSIVAMRDSMLHRGPDEQGAFIDNNLGFGHARLSIIGLETGAQPMSTECGSLWIAYNGETYNYLALRKELEAKGYSFRTESDTEVVLQLYAEYGPRCVEKMNGLFAFSIWDRKKQELYIARDRLGIKPLYYVEKGGSLAFASEIKALPHCGFYDPQLNVDAVFEYFLFRGVVGESTLFHGVKSLLPGHSMIANDKGIRIEQYWDGQTRATPEKINSLDEAADRLEVLLRDAVDIRLMSEVPLGTFCSGGVDSSLVTAIAAQLKNDRINTFSVGFEETDFDESRYARMVASKYDTQHHEVKVSATEFCDLLPEMVRLNDEPLHFANSVHIFALSKLAKEYVTVVLTGEGADELFLGYPRFHLPVIASRIAWARIFAAPLLSAVGAVTGDHRMRKLRRYLSFLPEQRVLMNAATSNPADVRAILDGEVTEGLGYRKSTAAKASALNDMMNQLSANDQHTYLVSILNRQDKMSMGASVEARVPFIDYRIVEFANRLPAHLKSTGFSTKEIVKRVASRYLPDEVVHRRKSGFGVPLRSYFRDTEKGLGVIASRLINELPNDGLLDKSALLKLHADHQAGSGDHSELLWTVTNFLTWKEEYAL